MSQKTSKQTQAASHNDLSGPALRVFFNIAQNWSLSGEEQRVLLGQIPESTYYKWKKGDVGKIHHDTLERISYIVGIYKALQILLPNPEAADTWVKKNNAAPLFNKASALDRMMSGNVSDLFVVRQYLDAQRGGWA